MAAVQFLASHINRILFSLMYYQVNVTAATAQVSGLSSVLLSYITLSTYTLSMYVLALIMIVT